MQLPHRVFCLQLSSDGKDQKSLLLSSYSEALDGTMYMQIDKVGSGSSATVMAAAPPGSPAADEGTGGAACRALLSQGCTRGGLLLRPHHPLCRGAAVPRPPCYPRLLLSGNEVPRLGGVPVLSPVLSAGGSSLVSFALCLHSCIQQEGISVSYPLLVFAIGVCSNIRSPPAAMCTQTTFP